MKKILKVLLILILSLTVVGAAGIAVFYFTYLKPRVDIGIALVDFFTFSSEEEPDSSVFLAEDGTGIILTTREEGNEINILLKSNNLASLQYSSDGISVLTKASSTAYLIPWADDVDEEIAKSPVIELLGINEETQKTIADALVKVRKIVLDPSEPQEIPEVNKALGLDTVSVDIKDILQEFEFTFKGEQTITVDGQEYTCEATDVHVPEDMVKQVLGMDMFNGFINTLGQVFSDADVTVYIKDGELIYMTVDTDFKYLPDLDDIDYSELLDGNTEGMNFKNMPITMNFYKINGNIVIAAACSPYNVDIDTKIYYSREIYLGNFRNISDEIDIFEMKKLRLLVEAAKWKEYIDGQSAD